MMLQDTQKKIPDRVTRQPDGTYLWSCVTDRKLEREGQKIALRMFEGIAAVVLFIGLFLTVRNDYGWTGVLITVGSAAGILLITIGVIHGENSMPGERRCTYRMSESGIRNGTGSRAATYVFQDTKKVIIGRTYIEMQAGFGAFRAYAPEEDMSFVRNYIMSHIPGDAEVVYE